MPIATREAMLAGLLKNERIIVGAYVDEQGGICPMLAAHRSGERTDFLSFAKSWDRFAQASGRSRRATERELRILITNLEDSLEHAGGLELDQAIAEHRALLGASRKRRRRVRDAADPTGPIIARRLRLALRDRRARAERPEEDAGASSPVIARR